MTPTNEYQVPEKRFAQEAIQNGAERGTVPAGVPAQAQIQEDASRFCPVCSQRLESRKCKLICNVCGYYMSCADYY